MKKMFELTEIIFLSLPLFCIVINKIVNHNPEPIFSVYQRPNGYYWIKVTLMLILLYLRELVNKIRISWKSEDELLKFQEGLDKDLTLLNNQQAMNAVHFNAGNKFGDHLIVGMTKRNNKLVDGYLYIKTNSQNIGLLQSFKLPDTALYQTDNNQGFEAEGISVQCLEPMKLWKVKYSGKMKATSDLSKIYDVDLEMTFTSELPVINYETNSDLLTIAKCIALEKWSSEFFQLLKEYRQTQYIQHGNIEGQMKINGQSFYLDFDGSKIRTFGKQGDWRNVHRYNLHMFTTENGDRFTIGDFCFPLTTSSFKIGFIYSAAERRVHKITYNDFKLYQHGESGKLPLDYAFTIEAGRKTYTIKVDVIDSPEFYISKDWECRIVERICSFQVNSMKGWGISECQQRNILGRDMLDMCGNSVVMLEEKQLKNSTMGELNEQTEVERQQNSKDALNTNLYPCEHCTEYCVSRVQLWKHMRKHDKTKETNSGLN